MNRKGSIRIHLFDSCHPNEEVGYSPLLLKGYRRPFFELLHPYWNLFFITFFSSFFEYSLIFIGTFFGPAELNCPGGWMYYTPLLSYLGWHGLSTLGSPDSLGSNQSVILWKVALGKFRVYQNL